MTPPDLLEFERRHPGHPPGKETRIIQELGISPPRYYQLLLRAATSPEGIASDAMTARWVRERSARRAAARERRIA
ncbi:DUF3263 domain-containing protein [Microbacterium sp.]|uniref:DUF3263 domain-containing protein n=1 Tax=Microbacterium sp. TaxID=51671 RepID=UPI003A954F39